jgi:hypothetical protein
MADLNSSVHETPGAYTNPPEQRRAAALQVCGRATDRDDAAHLLDVLGLLDTVPDSIIATAPPQERAPDPQPHPQPRPQPRPVRAARTAALQKPRRTTTRALPIEPDGRATGKGMAEPWMTREQCPQPPKPYHLPLRAPMWAEVMAAPQTWAEWMTERAARRAAEQTSEGRVDGLDAV